MDLISSRRVLLGATMALLVAATAAHTEDVAAGTAAVTIDNFTFAPAQITVKPGTRVTFTNHDDIPHSIVVPDLNIHSKALDTGDSYSTTFDSPGEHPYMCGLHPHMKGVVIVQ